MSRRLATLLLVWTLASANFDGPQEPQPNSADARSRIRVTSNLVILPVTVKDSAGNLVPGLQKGDFRISDDGVEQSISVFSGESFPLSLVVLVDDDLPSVAAEQMVKGLRAVAGGFGPEDEAVVCRFDLEFYPGQGFVHDIDALWKELKDAQSHSGPSTSGPVPFVTPPSKLWMTLSMRQCNSFAIVATTAAKSCYSSPTVKTANGSTGIATMTLSGRF